jgi:hypothetical protein
MRLIGSPVRSCGENAHDRAIARHQSVNQSSGVRA